MRSPTKTGLLRTAPQLLFLALALSVLWSFALSARAQDTAQELPPAFVPDLLAAVRIEGPVYFCGEQVPLDNPEVRERLEKELLLMIWDRAQTILWIKRAGRYFPHIEHMLDRAGMPDDLKYMAVIESGLRPHVGSHAGARGFWQFITSTAKNYGLVVHSRVDQRRNFYHSTRAALRYLQELHAMFGSWTLAAAAYNMGEAGLKRNIEVQKTRDFYNLHLPLETQRYILRAVAVKIIFNNLSRYGFKVRKGDLYPPLSFDTVTLRAPHRVHIQTVAEAANTYFKTIKDLNPEFRGYYLEKGAYTLLVPRGAGKNFNRRYAELLESSQQVDRSKVYVVRSGDSLSAIAARHGMRLSELIRQNKLNPKKAIVPGQRLLVD